MKLADVALPISDQEAKSLAIVFAPPLASRLALLHSEHGSSNCVPVPSCLRDGRLMLCGDVLTEIGPGGLLEAMWAHADMNVLMASVDVMPLADALALLPLQETPTPEVG